MSVLRTVGTETAVLTIFSGFGTSINNRSVASAAAVSVAVSVIVAAVGVEEVVVEVIVEEEEVVAVVVDEGKRSKIRVNVCNSKMLLVEVVVAVVLEAVVVLARVGKVSELELRHTICCRKHNLCIYI